MRENIENVSTELDFNLIVLSVLKEFANLTNSELFFEIDREEQIVIATLKNPHGFDITESFNYIRGLIAVAKYIGISCKDNNIILTLIFNYNK